MRHALHRPMAKIIEDESRPRLLKASVQHLAAQG